MYCPHCGALLSDDTAVCSCGQKAGNNEQNPALREAKNADENLSPKRKTLLTFAILANVFTVYFPILGLIFGIKAWRGARTEYIAYWHLRKDWMILVSRIVGNVCTFVSIGMMGFWSIYGVIWVIMFSTIGAAFFGTFL